MGVENARILWLAEDDELLTGYVEALEERGLAVDMHGDVDRALGDLQRHPCPYGLVLWDLALSPGVVFAREPTRGGMLTGRFFFDRLRAMRPEVPTLLFTLHRAVAAEWNAPHERRFAIAKQDVLPDELAAGIEAILR